MKPGLKKKLKSPVKSRDGEAMQTNFKTNRKSSDGRYHCDMCDKHYSGWKGLNEHKQSIHFDNVVVCDQCGKDFKSKSALRQHLKVHAERTIYKCNICEKLLISKLSEKACCYTSRRKKYRQKYLHKCCAIV